MVFGQKGHLPKAVNIETLTVKGETYDILRFPKGKGPTLRQSIALTKGMEGRRMLTDTEAAIIKEDPESNSAFQNALKLGEWTYILSYSEAAMDHIGKFESGPKFGLVPNADEYLARVLIVKHVDVSPGNVESIVAEFRNELHYADPSDFLQ